MGKNNDRSNIFIGRSKSDMIKYLNDMDVDYLRNMKPGTNKINSDDLYTIKFKHTDENNNRNEMLNKLRNRIHSIKINTKNIRKVIPGYVLISGAIIGIVATSSHLATSNINNNKSEITNEINESDNLSYSPETIKIKCIYELKAGDTLSEIANKYDIKINQINGIDKDIDINSIINVGDKIEFTYSIPEDKIIYATTEVPKDELYTDNLMVIADLYNTDVKTLARLNEKNANPNSIRVPNFKSINEIEEEYLWDFDDVIEQSKQK